MKITVRNRRWEFKEVPNLGKDEKGNDYLGHCDDPTQQNKAIKIKQGLTGKDRLDVIIHEILHAGFWDLDETVVDQMATDLARILDRLGYSNECVHVKK